MMMLALMNKVMMNMVKMMMNMMMTYMAKPMDMYHHSRLQIRFWRMSEGYLSLRMHYIVMYRVLQIMMRDQLSKPLFSITYHQHLVLNMLKT